MGNCMESTEKIVASPHATINTKVIYPLYFLELANLLNPLLLKASQV